jgi:L,D-transpeptidase catalytic domain
VLIYIHKSGNVTELKQNTIMNIIKKIAISVFFLLTSPLFAQSAFNGTKAEWGWSGKDYQKDLVIGVLEQNWGKISAFDLQSKVDKVTHAEFLWKVTFDQVREAHNTNSTYIVGGTSVTDLEIVFEASGRGIILLYSSKNLVGRVRCQSAAKREGKNSQLEEGDYTVRLKKRLHISQEFKGAEMPNALLIDSGRGIYIHNGDLSSTSGGCVRVSEPVGRELFRLVNQGVSVKVVHK